MLAWDETGFHTPKSLDVPHNVTLVTLPPQPPELMPVESLWHD